MTDIPFSSIDDQIKKLLSQNLIIDDIGYAKYTLELFKAIENPMSLKRILLSSIAQV